MKPAISYNPETRSLFVQAGFGTNVSPETFERKPINAGILIDISGSMGAEDNTSKSRLEWAKEAVLATLDNLVEGQDYLTITTFTNDAEQIWPVAGSNPRPVSAQDKKDIKKLIASIETQGSTNLNEGLNLSYKLLAGVQKKLGSKKSDKFNHRLITITDANLNVDPDEGGAVAQAEIMSETRGIDLTVVGVGLNFFQKFVDKLTTMRGGNYIFAQNGQDMVEYFDAFDTLVTSFAYDFVANLEFDESELEFVKAHGVPDTAAGDAIDTLVNIKTLFLTSSKNGGGARVLEFKVK